MSLIIDYLRSHTSLIRQHFNLSLSLRFATTHEYFQALQSYSPSLPLLTASPFLPLVTGAGDNIHSWAGYYFQFPYLKQMSRICEQLLRAVDAFDVLLKRNEGTTWQGEKQVGWEEEELGIMQHHDALPTTAYAFTHTDYTRRVRRAFTSLSRSLASISASMLRLPTPAPQHSSYNYGLVGGTFHLSGTCLLSGHYAFMDDDRIVHIQMGAPPVTLIASSLSSTPSSSLVHFISSHPDIVISDSFGLPVPSQAEPIASYSFSLFRISFHATVPALGAFSYTVTHCYSTWSTDQSPPRSSSCAWLPPSLSPSPPSPSLSLFPSPSPYPSLSSANIPASKLLSYSNTQAKSLLSAPTVGIYDDAGAIHITLQVSEVPSRSDLAIDLTLGYYNGSKDSDYTFNDRGDYPFQYLNPESIDKRCGPLYSEVIVRYIEGHVLTLRHDPTSSSSLIAEMRMTSLPPNVNLAMELSTDLQPSSSARFMVVENGFQPQEKQYVRSGMGFNTQPMVSLAWLEEGMTDDVHKGRRVVVETHDPRGVASRTGAEMILFWHRRSSDTSDAYHRGDDPAPHTSAVRISADRQATLPQATHPIMLVAVDGEGATGPVEAAEDCMRRDAERKSLRTSRIRWTSLLNEGARLGQGFLTLVRMRANHVDGTVDLTLRNTDSATAHNISLTNLFGEECGAQIMSLTFLYTMEEAMQRTTWGWTDKPPCTLQGATTNKLLVVSPFDLCSVRVSNTFFASPKSLSVPRSSL